MNMKDSSAEHTHDCNDLTSGVHYGLLTDCRAHTESCHSIAIETSYRHCQVI
jgi:hypothetical protein